MTDISFIEQTAPCSLASFPSEWLRMALYVYLIIFRITPTHEGMFRMELLFRVDLQD